MTRPGDRDGTAAHCRCGRGGAERRAASRGRGNRVARYRRVASPYRPSRTPTRGIPATRGEPPRLTRPRAGPGRTCGVSGRSRVRGSGPSGDWPPGPRLGTATWLSRPAPLLPWPLRPPRRRPHGSQRGTRPGTRMTRSQEASCGAGFRTGRRPAEVAGRTSSLERSVATPPGQPPSGQPGAARTPATSAAGSAAPVILWSILVC